MAKKPAKAVASDAAEHAQRRFLVGIGASAGGLEALTALFSKLPTDLNIPYVVAQHLSPTYRSMLAQLIGRETAMRVKEVEQGEALTGNTVYIAPANHNVAVRKGHLELLPPDPGVAAKPSVNVFFQSLAEEYKEDAVGVVLSGTGSDGASGIRAIKAEGGFAFAQAPATAKYDGMPQAAIGTGHVDWVLPPERIAEEIAIIVRTHGTLPLVQKLDAGGPATLKSLLGRLRERTRLDFSSYKETTLLRRIERRMAANRTKTLEEYIAVVGREADELDRLANDILISVTAFFRDPLAFDRLGDALLQRLEAKKAGEEVRIWVPGCATGEEVYSIAMLLCERLGQRIEEHPVQLFATDVDLNAMAVARRAVYPTSAVTGLSRDRVARYFNVRGDSYEVAKSLRDLVVFARQDLVQDPPFLRLDLISCRNVLIYFQNNLQSRVLEIFHYALKDAGILFLGKSETVPGPQAHLFDTVNREARLFARKGRSLRIPAFSPATTLQPLRVREDRKAAPAPEQVLANVLGDIYAPPAVLVDRSLNILAVRGEAARFLSFPTGRPELNLLACLPKALRAEAQVMAQQVMQRKERSVGRVHQLRSAGGDVKVRLALLPCVADNSESNLVVAFEILPSAPEQETQTIAPDGRLKEVEDELLATREHLQTVIEEQEASNEELQALNEELQASNEEMQASNEELQASNEELQSTNEELTTVNDELGAKNHELDRVNADLSSVLNTIGFPVLVVNEQLQLLRFNESAGETLRLDTKCLGRHANRIEFPAWATELGRYVSGLFGQRPPRPLHLSDGMRRYSLAAYSYSVPTENQKKAVVCLVDTTQLDAAAKALSNQQDQLMAILNNSADAIRLVDTKGHLVFANEALFRLLGLPRHRRDGRRVPPRIPAEIAGRWREEDRKVLRQADVSQVEECLQVSGREVILETRRVPIVGDDGEIRLMCVTSSDVTDKRRDEAQLRLAAQVFEASGEAIMITDARGNIISVNPAFCRITGYAAAEVIGHNPRILSSRQQDEAFYKQMWQAITSTGRWQGEIWNRRKSGEVFPEWVSISAVHASDGQPRNYIAIYTDISERKASEERVRYLAQYDFLTDLPNRVLFADRLQQAIGAAQREGTRLALMFLDLDHFKTINDSLGHNVGDLLLREVAQRLKGQIRVTDTVSRQGGDEFLLLVPGIEEPNDAAHMAKKLTEIIAEPYHIEGRKLVVTPSIGIALYPDDGNDMASLIRNADAAMYHAKQGGRNNYQFFTSDMNALAMERLTLETNLRHAIEEQQLVLHYQPQVSITTGRIVAAEALVRWNHPELGLVPPARFIPVAEETGQVTNIGAWVLRTAAAQLKAWHDEGLPRIPVAVNLSALQFRQGKLRTQVAEALAASGLDACHLQLEVTESVLMEEGEATAASMAALRDMHVEFAIDDFGTGYSSLAYLNRFHIGKLKIDQSFIRDLGVERDNRTIVAAIIGLAKSLGLRVLAEGVEEPVQLEFLQANGCDEAQGFLFGRPMLPEQFRQALVQGCYDIDAIAGA